MLLKGECKLRAKRLLGCSGFFPWQLTPHCVCVCVCVCVCTHTHTRSVPWWNLAGGEVRSFSLSKAHGQVLRWGSPARSPEPDLLVFSGGDYRA